MKRTLNYTAALATTATVALLAGGAHAQTGAVQYCNSTWENPAAADCVMPHPGMAAGQGSFPGSFQVPGTNTSFAVHGIIYFNLARDTGPHEGSDSFGDQAGILEGPGAPASNLQARATNGGLAFEMLLTRPSIETQTPTAYGLLKTYIEFDFNQTSGSALPGNADLVRLRHSYGTLGPWLIGQTITGWDDPITYPDLIDGSFDAGELMSPVDRKVQIRYTQLLGNGLSALGELDMPNYNTALASSIGTAADGAAISRFAPTNSTTAGFTNYPRFVAATQWDQPWGHVKLAAMGGINDFRQSTALTATSTQAANRQTAEYAFGLSGHLNTWGKDLLRAVTRFNHGAADYTDEMATGGEYYNETLGTRAANKMFSIAGSYEHWWAPKWRSNVSGGVAFHWGNPGFGTAASRFGIDKREYTVHANVLYSPVPQMDVGVEWARAYQKVLSGADGTGSRVEGQVRFYF